MSMTSKLNYLQFENYFNLNEYVLQNQQLFTYLPTLQEHFTDLVHYTWQGYKLGSIKDWDSLGDGKYDPENDQIDEESEESNWTEWDDTSENEVSDDDDSDYELSDANSDDSSNSNHLLQQ